MCDHQFSNLYTAYDERFRPYLGCMACLKLAIPQPERSDVKGFSVFMRIVKQIKGHRPTAWDSKVTTIKERMTNKKEILNKKPLETLVKEYLNELEPSPAN